MKLWSLSVPVQSPHTGNSIEHVANAIISNVTFSFWMNNINFIYFRVNI